MTKVKERIKVECTKKGISVSGMLMDIGIQSGDYYSALNGKIPFYHGWRVRICKTLGKSEDELFPEFKEREE